MVKWETKKPNLFCIATLLLACAQTTLLQNYNCSLAMFYVLPPTVNQTCLAIQIRLVRIAKSLLQNVEVSSTFCNKIGSCFAFTGPRQTCFAIGNIILVYGLTPS